MTDKDTSQWFDTIIYGGKNKPMMLATCRDAKRSGVLYNTVYDYVVVDPEELERCTFYRSETHDISLINAQLHLGLRIGNTYMKLGPPDKDGDTTVCEGTGLLCVIRNNVFASNVSMYDIRHSVFVAQHLAHKSETDEVGDKIREIIDNDRDVTATEIYKQLVAWDGGTSIISVYNAERDWALIDFGYLSPESLETHTLTNPGQRKGYDVRFRETNKSIL